MRTAEVDVNATATRLKEAIGGASSGEVCWELRHQLADEFGRRRGWKPSGAAVCRWRRVGAEFSVRQGAILR